MRDSGVGDSPRDPPVDFGFLCLLEGISDFLWVIISCLPALPGARVHGCVYVLSCVWLFVTPWPDSLFTGFSRQEHWSALLFPTLGDLPDPEIEPTSPVPLSLAGRFFTTGDSWEALLGPGRAAILMRLVWSSDWAADAGHTHLISWCCRVNLCSWIRIHPTSPSK